MSASRPQSPKAARPRWIRSPLTAANRADFPIVAIGASAGGLEACKKLLDALPADNGMAFLIVQHLDPSHDSLLVDLLSAQLRCRSCRRPMAWRSNAIAFISFRLASIFRSTARESCGFRDRWSVTARGCRSTSC